jgi:hypothetical protein
MTRRLTLTLLALVLSLSGTTPSAQTAAPKVPDAVTADAKHYTVEFENDIVRVLRVKIGAGEAAPAHAHPAYCAIRDHRLVAQGRCRDRSPTARPDRSSAATRSLTGRPMSAKPSPRGIVVRIQEPPAGTVNRMTRRYATLLACTLVACAVTLHAARLTLFIDGDNRTPYDASRGKVGRAEWTAAVSARKGTILTDDFQGVNIDVAADKATPVGHFSVFFSQTGGYSTQAGNTAPQKHPTGVFVGTTGTGSTTGKNDETIQGLNCVTKRSVR